MQLSRKIGGGELGNSGSEMTNLRKYGRAPFSVAVIHGGPGAPGEMAQVAQKLSSIRGILEPLQTADSLEGQVEELRAVLQENGSLPVVLIGHSWGAWLGFIVAACYPSLVRKLILIGCGPFEDKYSARIYATRLSRLSEEERAEYTSIIRILGDLAAYDKDTLLARLGSLASKADACDPVIDESEELDQTDMQGDIFSKVWKDAGELRKSGRLLELGERIQCPVLAIHGDYDPHPAEGVQKPLAGILENFRFILLKSCGHKPWIERQAKEDFYRVLEEELHGTVW